MTRDCPAADTLLGHDILTRDGILRIATGDMESGLGLAGTLDGGDPECQKMGPEPCCFRAVENWNRGDLNAYMDLYAENVVLHRVPPDLTGKAAVRTSYEGMWRAFPGSRLTLDDAIAEGDKVACRYTVETRTADGRQISMSGITILHFAGGKCVERWDLEAGHGH